MVTALSVGDHVKLAEPAHFSKSNISTDTFTVIRFNKRTPIFVAARHPGLICRLRRATLIEATITRG